MKKIAFKNGRTLDTSVIRSLIKLRKFHVLDDLFAGPEDPQDPFQQERRLLDDAGLIGMARAAV